ncbi:MAG: hypothetical protein KC910_17085, partial [Candidatus Eremiobacteraeota bacterium]|nr:hypothetical protein [Candidatus Eremiobacteraeota bacterium]
MRIHNLLFALTLVAVAVATGWWTRPEPIPEPALGVLTTESRWPEVVVRLTNVGGRPLQVTTCGYGEPCAADLSVDFHAPSG